MRGAFEITADLQQAIELQDLAQYFGDRPGVAAAIAWEDALEAEEQERERSAHRVAG